MGTQAQKHSELCHVSYVMLCAMWYHLCTFKNVRNTHGGVLLLVKLQPPAAGYDTVQGLTGKGGQIFFKRDGESKKRDCLKRGG